jgi:hypothetical protein
MTITLRSTKGSALTHAELDGNFTDLDGRATANAAAAASANSNANTRQPGSTTLDALSALATTAFGRSLLTLANAAALAANHTHSGGAAGNVSVRAVAPGNINLAAPGAALDGVTMVNGQTFLAPLQTTGSQNGIYVFNGAAAAATRLAGFTAYDAHAGVLVVVQEGTLGKDRVYLCTADIGGTIDTTGIPFVLLSAPAISEAGTAFTLNAARVGPPIRANNAAAITASFDFTGFPADASGVITQEGAGVVTLAAGPAYSYAPGVTASPTTAGQGGEIAWRWLGGTSVRIERRSQAAGGGSLPSAPAQPFPATVLGKNHANADAWLSQRTHPRFLVMSAITSRANDGAGSVVRSNGFGALGFCDGLNTGTTATGKASIRFLEDYPEAPCFPFKPKSAFSDLVLLPILATAGEDYRFVFGPTFEHTFLGIGAVGAWIEYDRSQSANWRCVTRNASVSTTTDSGVAVAANAVVQLTVHYVSATEVRFYINGALVATHTTNVPGDVACHVAAHLAKTAGTTSRQALVGPMECFREL